MSQQTYFTERLHKNWEVLNYLHHKLTQLICKIIFYNDKHIWIKDSWNRIEKQFVTFIDDFTNIFWNKVPWGPAEGRDFSTLCELLW